MVDRHREEFERRLDRAGHRYAERADTRLVAERRRGFLPRFLVAIVVGLAALPLVLSPPAELGIAFDQGIDAVIAQTDVAEEDRARLVMFGMIGLGFLAILLLRGVLARIVFTPPFMLGAIIGAFLWIPFGAHILGAAPELADAMPELEPRLESVASANALTDQARTWAEETFPPSTFASTDEQTQAAGTTGGNTGEP